jgi:sigma-B regulation protein RsbU (phosphoserine phosphatase)
LVRFCLDHLTAEELKAHQQDLTLATQIQTRLLPPVQISSADWDTHYRYEPVGAVGGDYCELVVLPDGELFFAVGDVAGKGVAASLLMTHLSAIFRSLISLELPLDELILRANRLFCDSTTGSHYATLACGRTTPGGMDLCNAGHCRPLLLRRHTTERVGPSGLPLGLFCNGRYDVRHVSLDEGDSLVLYTDGLTEAQDVEGNEYGEDSLVFSLQNRINEDAKTMADGILRNVSQYRGIHPPTDDATVLVIRRRRLHA